MTITANLADGRVLNFPDGTDPQVIQSTVKKMVSQQPQVMDSPAAVDAQQAPQVEQAGVVGNDSGPVVDTDFTPILVQYQAGALSGRRKLAVEELIKRGKFPSQESVTPEMGLTQTGENEYIEVENIPQFQTPESVTPEMGVTPTGANEYTEVAGVKDIPLTEALSQGLSNLPASSKKMVTSLIDAASQPGKTWEGLKTVAKDIAKNQVEDAIRSTLKEMGFKPSSKLKFDEGSFFENIEDTPALDVVIDDLEKSYGSYNSFKETLSKDPARVIIDVGSIVMPAAKGVESAAIAAKLTTVAKVAGATAKAAALTEPITAAVKIVKPISKLAGVPMKFLGDKLNPSKLYQDAAKMSTALSEADRVKMVKTALTEGILPNLEGLNKMDGLITTLDDRISSIIDTAQATKKTMPIEEVFKYFDEIESTYKLSGKSKESINSIRRIKKSFMETNSNLKSLTPKKAQKLKKRIYKDLRSYYEAVKSSPASVEAQQSMARASKEFLEGIAPEIKQLNQKDGAVIALRNALEKPASRIQNRAIVGMGSGIKTGIGTTIGSVLGSPELGVVAGVSFAILTDPIVQAKIAIAMNKASMQGIKISEKTVKHLKEMGLEQVQKAGKTVWTPSKRLIAEQVLTKTPASAQGEK